MSSALVNILIGLATSVISGGAVWLWDRAGRVRAARQKERFFGIEPGGTCLIVMNNRSNMVGSANHDDVQAMLELATLASGAGSAVRIESCNDFHELNGDRTEFCVGGPLGGSNPRTGGHLAANLPGVTIRPSDHEHGKRSAIVVGDAEYEWDRGKQEYALVAKFTPRASSRPVIIICGQSAIANRGAVEFLKREYRSLGRHLSSVDKFCIVVSVASTQTYGHQAAELTGDVSASAFRTRAL